MIKQFGAVSNTLQQISSEFNSIVASSSRLITGRKKRQSVPAGFGNPFEVISGLLGQLTRQANDLSSQVTGLFGNFGNQVSGAVRGSSTGPLGGITDSVVGAVNSLQRGITG